MSSIFLISVVGKDNLDTLNNLAELTHSHQGKWLNSRVIKLEGLFSSIIKVEVPDSESTALQAALKALPELQLAIYPTEEVIPSNCSKVSLVIDAEDRPGLINDITELFAQNSIHINKMESHRVSVQGTGKNVFSAEFDIQVPENVNTPEIIAEIESLKPKVMVNQI